MIGLRILYVMNLVMFLRALYWSVRAFRISEEPFKTLRLAGIFMSVTYAAIFAAYLAFPDYRLEIQVFSFAAALLSEELIWTRPAKVNVKTIETLEAARKIVRECPSGDCSHED